MQILAVSLILGLIEACLGARILGLLPMPSRSHGILMESLMRELGNRGHHVTYIAAQPPVKGPIPNLTLIEIPNVHEQMSIGDDDDMTKDMFSGLNPLFMFIFSFAGPKMSDHILLNENVQKMIQSNEKFDLILGEIFMDESLLAGFAHRYQAPIVGVMPFLPNIWGNYMTGNPAPSSHIPEPTLGLTTKMTFCERVWNFLYTFAWDIHHPLIYLRKHDEVMRKHFGNDIPHIREILRNTSLVLVNNHHSLAFPRPYLPNMVEVGGMHIAPLKPLPKDLQKYLDDSKEGVILFSLGSNLQSSEMPQEKIDAILKAFSKLPYNVLWKFEEKLENLPKNVRVSKWLPQSDILGHPNLKLFITHGGLLSTTEAVYRGVPVVGIPIFGDQPLNMKMTEQAGLGKMLIFKEITTESLYDAIIEVTSNPKYKEAAKKTSVVFHDNPQPPLERAMWWIEYVLRHKGAPHLRSAAQSLPYYQLYQIDVIAVLIIAPVLSSYAVCFTACSLIRLVRGNKKTEKKQKQAKKKNQ